MEGKPKYFPASEFHGRIKKVYSGNFNWAVNKKQENMAHVLYEAVHENPDYEDERRGAGKDHALTKV